jgi:hypothetical protein
MKSCLSNQIRACRSVSLLILSFYIDTLVPEDSELYLWMTGARGIAMPLEGSNASYNAKVLRWIEQGALNN